jgi:hypothetical protein
MAGQNTSSAVMQQRAEPNDSLDDFPTPPWAGRALMEHVLKDQWRSYTLWEPAVNRGFLLRGLADYLQPVRVSDVHDYGCPGTVVEDFLWPGVRHEVDWVITNPPFRLAHGFIDKALSVARVGCAMLVRTSFLEGVNRYDSLWSLRPPTFVAQFAQRVPMVRGRCDAKASTATSYCWIGWVNLWERRPMMWVPPCRKTLERPGDYDMSAGCTRVAPFGFGVPSKGRMRWACADHRKLLESGVPQPPEEDGRAAVAVPLRPSSPYLQGRLL